LKRYTPSNNCLTLGYRRGQFSFVKFWPASFVERERRALHAKNKKQGSLQASPLNNHKRKQKRVRQNVAAEREHRYERDFATKRTFKISSQLQSLCSTLYASSMKLTRKNSIFLNKE
jgi:hypothetical protein